MSAAPYTQMPVGFSELKFDRVAATVEALAAVTAERDAAREEQREACALHLEGTHRQSSGNCNDRWNATVASGATTTASPSCGNCTRAAAIRATPLTATPLADRLRAQMSAVLHIIGGTVEGAPTHSGNYLQRLRELVAAESRIADLKAQLRDEADVSVREIKRAIAAEAELAAATALVEATRAEMVRQAELAHDSARADRERVAVLEAALMKARPYVESASTRMYDGTGGNGMRREAAGRLATIDAALSATPEAGE